MDSPSKMWKNSCWLQKSVLNPEYESLGWCLFDGDNWTVYNSEWAIFFLLALKITRKTNYSTGETLVTEISSTSRNTMPVVQLLVFLFNTVIKIRFITCLHTRSLIFTEQDNAKYNIFSQPVSLHSHSTHLACPLTLRTHPSISQWYSSFPLLPLIFCSACKGLQMRDEGIKTKVCFVLYRYHLVEQP